ncbi:MAG: ergothioneine biosynthesis protein EgtB [Alphaproteobacteria bacterium]|nr:ergothioneine biosynthesis protein EgtB [Alphaproteobacteria bacterium]
MALLAGKTAHAENRAAWRARFADCRARSAALATPLLPEDQVVQSMPDVSPTKWHLAHVTWFWETFLLGPHLAGYRVFDPAYDYLFNSYYEAVGPRHPRPARGLLSRPGVAEIARYRDHVTQAMDRLIAGVDGMTFRELAPVIALGLAHEEQHQELILMDIKHVFAQNPLKPAYTAPAPHAARTAPPLEWRDFAGGLIEIGHEGDGFAFDNEGPRHKVWLEPFRLATRLVTNGEYLAFVADGGYRRPEFWLSDGWAAVNASGWEAPLYWQRPAGKIDGVDGWQEFTLSGIAPLDPASPVVHVSHYEADAFARWAGRRLPSEAEWETAAADLPVSGNFLDRGLLHPQGATSSADCDQVDSCPPHPALDKARLRLANPKQPSPPSGEEGRVRGAQAPRGEEEASVVSAASAPALLQMFGDCWEWTQSAYAPYPGFHAVAGAIGEYNGKFMSGQMVLKGGCAVTPAGHMRASYRNFFPAAARWCFGGIRLAEDG